MIYQTRFPTDAPRFLDRVRQRGGQTPKGLNSIFIFPREWDEFTLACIFIREAIGKKIKNVIGTDLREIRNKIAHAVLSKGALTLSIDKIVDIQFVNKWIPLTKYIARYMMLKEFFQSGIGNSDNNRNK